MNRRAFLGRLASAAAVAPIAAHLARHAPDRAVSTPAHQLGAHAYDREGRRYVYVRAIRDTRMGDLIIADGWPFGVATCDMRQGDCGWVRTSNLPVHIIPPPRL